MEKVHTMSLVTLFQVIFIVTFFVITCQTQTWSNFKGTNGKVLNAEPLYLEGMYGQIQCLRLCARTPACLSYNYYKSQLKCVLYGEDSSTHNLTDDSDAMFEERGTIPTDSLLGPCGAFNCPPNSECVELSNNQPVCIINACSTQPSAVADATFTALKTVYSLFDTISFQCNGGLDLSGNPNTTCMATGTWTQPVFSCDGCPSETPSLVNGVVSPGDTIIGTVRTYTCNNGYTSGGVDLKTTCNTDVTWSALAGTCSPVDCGQPSSLSGASIDNSPSTTYQASRTYTCDTGYTPNSGTGTITCQASGSWSSSSLTCTIVDCMDPSVTEQNGEVSNGCTTYDCSRTFSCASGYDISGSVFTVTCQSSGSWTGSSYSCSPVDCGQPSSYSGLSIEGSSSTIFQASRTYSCDTGYTPNSLSGTITCQASGSWSSPSFTCTIVDCGEPTVTEQNGVVSSGCTTYDCSRTFSCASGYDISGSVFTVTCQSSGSWTGSSYSCSPAVVTCPSHPVIAYTTITGSGTAEGTTISYSCDVGAILESGVDPATSTCTNAGAWSTPNIDCNKCSSYKTSYTKRENWFFNPPVSFTPSISGGSVTASYCANACNTRSDFFCVAYYYRKSTGGYCILRPMRVHDNTNHLQHDNAHSSWDEYIRNCEIPCPDPPYVAYTSVSGTGSSRSYTCDVGAILVSGDNPATSTCTNGVWSSVNIQCTKCSSYKTSYTKRENWFFNPPVSFTPSISGGSVTASYCANACNTRSDFFCVAYYYRKSTGGYCILRPMRVHDNTNHLLYDNAHSSWDEYIRNCD